MSETKAKGRLVVSRPVQKAQTTEERLAAMEARLERIEELLKKALG